MQLAIPRKLFAWYVNINNKQHGNLIAECFPQFMIGNKLLQFVRVQISGSDHYKELDYDVSIQCEIRSFTFD